MLEAIIPSKTRRKVLAFFFANQQESVHLRKLTRLVDEEINAVKRETEILRKAGALLYERRANRVLYTLNKKWELYDEFLRIMAKEGATGSTLRKIHSRLGKVSFAVVSYAFLRGEAIQDHEIYFLFVGIIVIPEVDAYIKSLEKGFPFEVNYTVMTDDEFAFRKKNNDPFIWNFLHSPHVSLLGDESAITI
ncbi:MAG: hypothetical protein UZ21_OP11001000838 [Microgenomates bacterium OLB22]|nr:MAG: hypothetical protein UZ21_OP11001000838 [Microgenomates bacterium OLB22]